MELLAEYNAIIIPSHLQNLGFISWDRPERICRLFYITLHYFTLVSTLHIYLHFTAFDIAKYTSLSILQSNRIITTLVYISEPFLSTSTMPPKRVRSKSSSESDGVGKRQRVEPKNSSESHQTETDSEQQLMLDTEPEDGLSDESRHSSQGSRGSNEQYEVVSGDSLDGNSFSDEEDDQYDLSLISVAAGPMATEGGARSPNPPSSSSSSSSDSEILSSDPEETPNRISRIRDCIAYSRTQRQTDQPYQSTTDFTLTITHPALTTSLQLLRSAVTSGLAFLVGSTLREETFRIGVRPVIRGLRSPVDPTWFAVKSRAEIKAGPLADEKDVKKAGTALKGADTRRRNEVKKAGRDGKTRKEMEVEDKLAEGLRRQEAGERMHDSSSVDDEDEDEDDGSEDDSDSDSQPGNDGAGAGKKGGEDTDHTDSDTDVFEDGGLFPLPIDDDSEESDFAPDEDDVSRPRRATRSVPKRTNAKRSAPKQTAAKRAGAKRARLSDIPEESDSEDSEEDDDDDVSQSPPRAARSVPKRTAAKRTAAKQPAAKRTAAKQTAAKQPAAKRTAAKRTAAKRTDTKRASAKRARLPDIPEESDSEDDDDEPMQPTRRPQPSRARPIIPSSTESPEPSSDKPPTNNDTEDEPSSPPLKRAPSNRARRVIESSTESSEPSNDKSSPSNDTEDELPILPRRAQPSRARRIVESSSTSESSSDEGPIVRGRRGAKRGRGRM
ncbi:hypothetical protein P280DRAFT_87430 [Massarina eburnea CBS 473.64]|uniref:Uncharacterized protein n=1 Tax=Massarina eburnea CBS 473.64 TaxID=1395130 RepID=A0A6A6RQU0_9PLEO|nr:hypothetical protein P280DRAFT_87430 [Massarina eburnea CBS 473.64]